jgi:hypothetical protein
VAREGRAVKRWLLAAIAASIAFGVILLVRSTPDATREKQAASALPLALPESPATDVDDEAYASDDAPAARVAVPGAASRVEVGRDQATSSPAPPADTCRVRLQVSFFGTGVPVRSSLAALTYDIFDHTGASTTRMKAGADGRFELDLPVGARLRAVDVCGQALMLEGPLTPANAAARFRPLHAPLDLRLGEAGTELRFEVQPALVFAGVVRDAKDGKPIADADVAVQLLVGRRLRTRTGSDGRFRLTEPGAGRLMRVSREGYVESEVLLLSRDFGPAAGEFGVALDRPLRVSGRVLDARDSPIAGMRLELHARGGVERGRSRVVRERWFAVTDVRGNFAFEDVAHAAAAEITESNDYNHMLMRKPLLMRRELGQLDSDREDVVLECRDSTLVDVRVLRLDGTSVNAEAAFVACEDPGLAVPAFLDLPDRRNLMFLAVGVPVHFVALAREREDDPHHLLLGRLTVNVQAAQDSVQEARVALDGRVDDTPPASTAPEITLDEEGIVATLDLRLLDDSGSPFPPGTRMDFELAGTLFPDLAPGESVLRLRCHPSYSAHRARVQIGGQSRTFDLVVPWSGYTRAEQRVSIVP